MGSSQDRVLAVLNLFDDATIAITHDTVALALDCSRATAYRYLKALSQIGLLTSTGGGDYVLGPKIVELDRLIRKNDPLLTAARPIMEKLSQDLEVGVMLCSYYGDQVLLTDAIWGPNGGPPDYERGRPMSMFSGAMAKVILANISPYQLKKLMLNQAAEIGLAGLGSSWTEFNANMTRIRREVAWISHAEVVAGLYGVAAPLFDPDDKVIGSITLAITESRFEAMKSECNLPSLIIQAAAQITGKLRQH